MLPLANKGCLFRTVAVPGVPVVASPKVSRYAHTGVLEALLLSHIQINMA